VSVAPRADSRYPTREATVTVPSVDSEGLGLDVVDVVTCEGPRGVVGIQVKSEVDGERLSEFPTAPWYERVDSAGSSVAYLLAFDVHGTGSVVACEELLRCDTIDGLRTPSVRRAEPPR